MVGIKGMEMQTDCKKCPLMATDGVDKFNPMICIAIWATKHEIKRCIEGKVLDDCPLKEIITCKNCKYCNRDTKEGEKLLWCKKDGFATSEDYYCGSGKERVNDTQANNVVMSPGV